MYEYLVENLISYSQVDGNLRRTADRGLVSELYRRQMNALALKYFGVDSNGNYTENKEDIVAYRCPYSGEIISDLSNAHLEHILPVSSNGGTILFNCIPILDKVNLSKRDEPNLLVWWQEQDYFNYDRLERLIQYMLEAYTLAFKEPTEEELYDYDSSYSSDDYIENDDLSIDLRSKSNKTNNHSQNITYYQLLTDMINELSKDRDVSKYSTQLNDLKEQNIFGNIDEIEKVIKSLQNVFKVALGEDSKKYLSYSLKIDMNKLLKSFKTKDYENEIKQRLYFIEKLIKDNGKQIEDFFDSIQDIDEYNLLYYDNPTDEQVTIFINNIKISHESKIRIFIDMLSDKKYTNYINGLPDNNNVFSARNKILFEGYEHIDGLNTSYFWGSNSSEIIETIYIQKQKLESKENRTQVDDERLNKLNLALKAIDDYDFANKNNSKRRIEKFIDMLANSKYTNYINGLPDNNNIFSNYNEVGFEGYEHIDGLNTSQFWAHNSDKIIETIYAQKKELGSKENRTQQENEKVNKLNIALKAIDDYDFANISNLNRRIEKFIDMLANSKYTNYINGLFDNNNIFSRDNEVGFEGYEYIDGLNTSHFWTHNSDKIIETIYAQKKELENKENRTQIDDEKLNKLNLALKAIDDYDFANKTNSKRRIEKFIDMLANSKYTNYINGVPDSNNIFSVKNKIPFDGYENIDGLNTSLFYKVNSNKSIIPLLFYNKIYDKKNKTYIKSDLDYSSPKYDAARNAVMEYLNYCRRRKKQSEFKSIDEYIDTLDKTKKETKLIINLRDSLISKRDQLLAENQELTKKLNTSARRAM